MRGLWVSSSQSAVINFTPQSKLLTALDAAAAIDAKARFWSKIAIFAPFREVPVRILR